MDVVVIIFSQFEILLPFRMFMVLVSMVDCWFLASAPSIFCFAFEIRDLRFLFSSFVAVLITSVMVEFVSRVTSSILSSAGV